MSNRFQVWIDVCQSKLAVYVNEDFYIPLNRLMKTKLPLYMIPMWDPRHCDVFPFSW